MNALWREIIGEPDAGKPHVRFDEGALSTMGLPLICSSRVRRGVVVEGHCRQRSTLHRVEAEETLGRVPLLFFRHDFSARGNVEAWERVHYAFGEKP